MSSVINLARKAIQQLVPYSSARNESTQEGVRLDANENPFWRKDGLNRYPFPQPLVLRPMLAKYYGVEEEQLLITRGSDEGIELLLRTFCEANKDAIAITPPTYGMYEVAANIQGIKVITVPLDKDQGFALDRQGLLNLDNPSLKLIFLCSPNNPTGNVLSAKDVLTLCEAMKERALVVLDEAYSEFANTPSLSAKVSQYPNLVVLRTLSKAFGLAGARVGALLAAKEVIALLQKVLAPYPIPKPVEQVAIKALSPTNLVLLQSQIKRIKKERKALSEYLSTLSSVEAVYPSEANFLLVKVRDVSRWMAVCRDHQVILRARTESCVRITIGSPKDNARLKEVLTYV